MKKKFMFRWGMAYWVSRFTVKYLFRNQLAYDKELKLDTSKPFVLLGNHSCFYDFLFAMNAIGPQPVKFVVAARYFSNPIIGPLLKFYGAIPKKLAEKDFECMKKIMTSLKKGENVVIYPEGRVSMWGCTECISPATAKLVKRYDCNLVMVQNLGTYFVNPPYGGTKKYGKTHTKVFGYDSTFLNKMTNKEVIALINDTLMVDQYEWYGQKSSRKYLGREGIKSLENLLYRCPSCNEILGLKHVSDKLQCKECGLEGIVNDCHMQWNKEGLPSSISTIYKWYKDFEKEAMLEEDWCIETNGVIEVVDLSKKLKEVYSNCNVSMDLEYVSISINDEIVKLELDTIDYVPFDVGSNFQIYNNGKMFLIKPTNRAMATAFAVMHESMKNDANSMVEQIAN